MGEVVNLNRARKARKKAEEQRKAEENRVRFGRPKAERRRDAAEKEREQREHDGKQLE